MVGKIAGKFSSLLVCQQIEWPNGMRSAPYSASIPHLPLSRPHRGRQGECTRRVGTRHLYPRVLATHLNADYADRAEKAGYELYFLPVLIRSIRSIRVQNYERHVRAGCPGSDALNHFDFAFRSHVCAPTNGSLRAGFVAYGDAVF